MGLDVYVCKVYFCVYMCISESIQKVNNIVGCQWGGDLGIWKAGVGSCVIAKGREYGEIP